ncbi:hypothetical protein PHYBOEH_007808 [Phytophthora boehmeriae]|uniref:Uncharacterized protein n=1 Tax=Phytophthora boehmeriae TaxID=109152 RepID=A0A8T1W8J4_9STRA|nr:hypothetical protein PHYBOEH_007808 [Phytophthora boehmeriae]
MTRVGELFACLISVWSLWLLRISSAQTDVKSWTRDDGESTTVNCSALSPPANTKFWEAMDRCYGCAAEPSCGFCSSTLTCVAGNLQGPYQQFQIWCSDWIPEAEACPVNPQCDAITDCGVCASSTECVWCASDASCMAVEEGYGSGCKALVREIPCPKVVVPETIIVGDVIINQKPPNVTRPRKLQDMCRSNRDLRPEAFLVALALTAVTPLQTVVVWFKLLEAVATGSTPKLKETVVNAGESSGMGRTGGKVILSGGTGSGTNAVDGGDGGGIDVIGGEARGSNALDNGGSINVEAGRAAFGYGGDITMTSATSSGAMALMTAPSGTKGTSGAIVINTGDTTSGDSGELVLYSGQGLKGKGGFIALSVGNNTENPGGDVSVQAGLALHKFTGGSITITTGGSLRSTSGDLVLQTPNSGPHGGSGSFALTTGKALATNSGSMSFVTGVAKKGHGGSVLMSVGVGDTGNGGDVNLTAGDTTGRLYFIFFFA